jgi:hypothetical protein
MTLSPGSRANAFSVVSAPFIPGMAKSMKTTSASVAGSIARNSSPVEASPTNSVVPVEQSPHPAAEQRVIVHQYNSAKFHRYSFSADSAWVLTRIFACIPTPLALVMSNRPFRELIREAMFDNPMPQSVTAAGLNPRPLSV